jgi:nucleotide-binding universal stress UspA family protein
MQPFAPRRIVAATDFSEVSTWALRHAALWAQRYGAALTVLHAHEISWITGALCLGRFNLTELTEQSRTAVAEHLASYALQHVTGGVPTSPELREGSPARVIDEYAGERRADLVVLGTHGRGGLGRLLLGSVAERTLRLARQPTLLVRYGPDQKEGAAPQVRHILCPMNYTEVARAAFEHACSVARTFAARLTVVFVVEQETGPPGSIERAEEMLRAWLPAEAQTKFAVEPVIRHGDAAEQILALAREEAVDLVVIGAQHQRFVDTTVLGVTTVRVTRHAPCPVLVVPRPLEA